MAWCPVSGLFLGDEVIGAHLKPRQVCAYCKRNRGAFLTCDGCGAAEWIAGRASEQRDATGKLSDSVSSRPGPMASMTTATAAVGAMVLFMMTQRRRR